MTTQRSPRRSAARAPETVHPWPAFFLSVPLYLFLSFREISAWTPPVWAALAFGLIPVLCGLALGRGGTAGEKIRAALGSVGTTMTVYTLIHLIRLRPESAGGSVVPVIAAVSLVYGAMAGLVGAAASSLRSRFDTRKEVR